MTRHSQLSHKQVGVRIDPYLHNADSPIGPAPRAPAFLYDAGSRGAVMSATRRAWVNDNAVTLGYRESRIRSGCMSGPENRCSREAATPGSLADRVGIDVTQSSSPFGYARSRIDRDGAANKCALCGDSRSAVIELPICARCAFQIYNVIAPLFGSPGRPELPLMPTERDGHVYYIRRGDLIKIGFTSDLPKRMRALLPDEVLAVEPGTMRLERDRQRQFAEWRYTHGCGPTEWFFDTPALRDHIGRVVATHGPAPALPTLTTPRVIRTI